MNKKDYIILFIKGIIIGIGKILPGISGAMIAISLNIYQQSLSIISHPLKKIKKNIPFILPIALGILIGITIGSNVILKLLTKYYLPCMLLFIGLILGNTINIIKKNTLMNSKRYFIIPFLIIITIGLITPSSSNLVFNNDLKTFIILVPIGFIEALSMIVPGLSGTALMMLIGCYFPLLEVWSNILNINAIISNITILLPFTIGLIIGIIILSRIMTYLLNNYHNKTMISITGFTTGSIILLYLNTLSNRYLLIDIIIGMILFVFGYIITNKLIIEQE